MNRKLYEAVPVEPWKKKPSMKEVPGLDSNGDINMVKYFPDYGTFYFVETDKEIGTKTNNGSNIITHILVAVEEVDKWISPEDKKITMQDFEDAIYDEHITKPFAENWRKLGEYLKNEQKEGKTEFRIAFQNANDFIVHPLGENGDTMDMTLTLPSAPKQDKQK